MSSSGRPKGKQSAAVKAQPKRIRTIDDIADMNEARKKQELRDLEDEAEKLLATQPTDTSTTTTASAVAESVATTATAVESPPEQVPPPRAVTPGTTLGDLAAQVASSTRPVAPTPVRPMRFSDLASDAMSDALPGMAPVPAPAPVRPRSGAGIAPMPTMSKPPNAPARSKQDVIDAAADLEKASARFYALERLAVYNDRYKAECGKHIPKDYQNLSTERLIELCRTCVLATSSANERTAICYGISAIGHVYETFSPAMPSPYCNSEGVARTLEALAVDYTTPLGRAVDLLALMYMGKLPGDHPIIQIALGVALGIKTVCTDNTIRLAATQQTAPADVPPPTMNGL